MVDPRTYRKRLAIAGAFLLPLLLLIFGFHARDALGHGESLWPVAIGIAISLSVIGSTLYFVSRDGAAGVSARAARLAKWLAPIAAALALVRLVVYLVRGQ